MFQVLELLDRYQAPSVHMIAPFKDGQMVHRDAGDNLLRQLAIRLAPQTLTFGEPGCGWDLWELTIPTVIDSSLNKKFKLWHSQKLELVHLP